MEYAAIGPIAIYLPETVEDNALLEGPVSPWDMDLIYAKTGIRARHIAGPDQCASDLGVAAAEQLFAEHDIDRSTIDFLLFCTQTPDYPLPTTACLMQDRLGLPTSIGALDFNLGCSGFVYGLSLADGLIRSGAARRMLFITAETYSKYIHPTDRSLRTIFGDGAAATLIEAAAEPSLGSFVFGTDGRGGRHADGQPKAGPGPPTRPSSRASGNAGPAASSWTVRNWSSSPSKWCRRWSIASWPAPAGPATTWICILMHQATTFMLNHLRERMEPRRGAHARGPGRLRQHGLFDDADPDGHDLRDSGRLRPGKQTLMVGFGVGLSWAGCVWTETWEAKQLQAEEKKSIKVADALKAKHEAA